jgi:flagellar basal-body rod protein FlgB
MNGINDATMDAIRVSLRGLAARQRSIADNISNIETPGYRAKLVSFETSLQRAIEQGAPGRGQTFEARSAATPNLKGNNVSLDDETLALVETNLRYQLSVESMNAKFRLLRTAISSQ